MDAIWQFAKRLTSSLVEQRGIIDSISAGGRGVLAEAMALRDELQRQHTDAANRVLADRLSRTSATIQTVLDRLAPVIRDFHTAKASLAGAVVERIPLPAITGEEQAALLHFVSDVSWRDGQNGLREADAQIIAEIQGESK